MTVATARDIRLHDVHTPVLPIGTDRRRRHVDGHVVLGRERAHVAEGERVAFDRLQGAPHGVDGPAGRVGGGGVVGRERQAGGVEAVFRRDDACAGGGEGGVEEADVSAGAGGGEVEVGLGGGRHAAEDWREADHVREAEFEDCFVLEVGWEGGGGFGGGFAGCFFGGMIWAVAGVGDGGGAVWNALRGAAHEEDFCDHCFGTRDPFQHLFHFCDVYLLDQFGVAPTRGSIRAGMQARGVFDCGKSMGQELCGALFRGWKLIEGW